MATKEQSVKIPFGLGHTKFYSKSIISDFLCERDEQGNIVTISSDVNLLLRQKTMHRKVGIEQLRDYVQNLMHENKDTQHNFTDDELFQLIEPKSINNLTTSYEYAKYLQANSKDVKQRYDKLVKDKEDYENYIKERTKKID